MAYLRKSTIYWRAWLYDFSMTLLMGREKQRIYSDVAALIPNGASVVELCCGTGSLYRDHLRQKSIDYCGLDFNGHFVRSMQRRGLNARIINLLEEDVPSADYIVMCSSFMYFCGHEERVLGKLRRAARRRVIISEPVRNLSQHGFRLLGRGVNALTRAGVGDHTYRFDLESFQRFAERTGASDLRYEPGSRNAVALFEPVGGEFVSMLES